MNLLKSKLSVAIAAGLLSGSALAAVEISCPITPAYSIITEGQTLQLTAECTDGVLASIDWRMAAVTYNTDGATVTGVDSSVTGVVPLTGYVAGNPIKYTTPVGLGDANETQEFTFTVVGVPKTAGDTFVSTSAKVVIKPSSAVVALAKGVTLDPLAPTKKVDAECGSADGKTVTTVLPEAHCATGSTMTLPVSGPQYFTWSCLSLTGGAEASCYAMREGYVAPVEQTATVNGACGSAINSSFSSAPTANLCSTGYGNTSPVVTGSTYTWSCKGSNAAATSDDTSCSATIATVPTQPSSGGSVDPGIGSGLWVPADYPNLYVADQSGTGISTSYVPGCLNGTDPGSSSWSGCAANTSFTASGVKVEIMKGKVLSVRYKSNSTAGSSKKWFTVTGFDGGNTGPVYVWLTDDPRKTYAQTDSKCKAYSTSAPSVITGYYKTSTYCQISPNKTYYLNIESGLTTASKFKIFEDASDMLP